MYCFKVIALIIYLRVCALTPITCAFTINNTTLMNYQGSEVQLRGSNVTHSMETNINGTTVLPPLVCLKIPMYEGCPDCSPHESPYRCFFRGFLGVAIVLVLAGFIVICGFCCWYQSIVCKLIYKYQESMVGRFTKLNNLDEEEKGRYHA